MVVTAQARAALEAAPKAALADAVLSKPATASSLFNAVQSAMARYLDKALTVPQPGAADGLPGQRLAGVHLLVVDDSSINLEVAGKIIEREGGIATTACDGAQAVALLQSTPDAFDAVLMDVQMPVLDGNQAARRIRNELGLAVPIIALTAGALVSERQRTLDAGMNDFVSKPFDAAALIRRVRRHVGARAGGLAGMAVPEPQRAPASWPQVDGIDGADVAARLSGDEKLFSSMLQRLLNEFGDLAERPPAGSDRAPLAARLHKLRGSAGMLGARPLAGTAGELEEALRRPDGEADDAAWARLALQLTLLKEAAGPLLISAGDPPVDDAKASTAPLQSADLERLIALLEQHSLDAADLFVSLSPSLALALVPQRFEALREALDELRYRDAAALARTLA